MPDLSASTNSLGNSADATEPRAIEADDEDLQTVAEHLPSTYDLQGEVICLRQDRGKYKPLCGPIFVTAEA